MRIEVDPLGRQRIIAELVQRDAFTLNLGCKTVTLGHVRVDISNEGRPSVVADARQLPFKDESFDQVIFADVIEHLPKGTEDIALQEIRRVLRSNGGLIVSTPNDFLPFNLMDPAWYLGHRHYLPEDLVRILQRNGFECVLAHSRGGFFTAICSCIFANRWLLKSCPRWLLERSDREFSNSSNRGHTLFHKALKRARPPSQPSTS